MNITEKGRAITTVTVVRTQSLRENFRQITQEEKNNLENDMLIKNQRSLSNEKISTDYKALSFTTQRGSSLRHNSKTTFPSSSPISGSHHSFQIIKPIETSPRTSESVIDSDSVKNSQKFKFKPRINNSSQGGPLIPDHNLKMESHVDNKFTPRPPLSKRYTPDPDDANSDIDSNQPGKNPRTYSFPIPNSKVSASKPLRSPTRAIPINLKGEDQNCQNSLEKQEKYIDINDEYINGIEDNIQSDCEGPPILHSTGRSSLRKGTDSPNYTDSPSRNSPSPTKTVKWNPNLSAVKNIPVRPKPVRIKSKPKPMPPKEEFHSMNKNPESETDTTAHISMDMVESHELFISQCTSLIRNQVSLLENFRQDRISLNTYQKDLMEQIDYQRKLISNFHLVLTTSLGSAGEH